MERIEGKQSGRAEPRGCRQAGAGLVASGCDFPSPPPDRGRPAHRSRGNRCRASVLQTRMPNKATEARPETESRGIWAHHEQEPPHGRARGRWRHAAGRQLQRPELFQRRRAGRRLPHVARSRHGGGHPTAAGQPLCQRVRHAGQFGRPGCRGAAGRRERHAHRRSELRHGGLCRYHARQLAGRLRAALAGPANSRRGRVLAPGRRSADSDQRV